MAALSAMQGVAIYLINIWGRGTGKSGTIGLGHYNRLIKLPRAKWFLIAPTYKQILNNCLSPMIDLWTNFGLREYDWKTRLGHYTIGRTPPPHFEKPYKPPRQYDHVITFWNGYTIEMMSMDRPDLNRGGSFDGGDADELALIKRDHLEKNILPTIRGNKDKYGNNPWHGKFSGYTSMPWKDSGQFVLEYELKAKEDPRFLYSEATAHCNLYALGPDWIENQKAILTPEVFDIEIMNLRKRKAEGMFYHKFSEAKHTYDPVIKYIDDPGGRGIMVDRYTDHNPEQLIDISWDFGGWFTGALLFQQRHTAAAAHSITEHMIDSFYVLKGGSAEDLVDNIVSKYSHQGMKYVRLWGEPRGHDPSAHGKTLYEKVRDRFAFHKWLVEICVTNNPAHSHDRRYVYLNDVMEETKGYPKLRCNSETCKAPILAIQFAEKDAKGHKDKSKEKDRDFDQRLAPHFTDALDYFFMQKHYRQDIGSGNEAWFS